METRRWDDDKIEKNKLPEIAFAVDVPLSEDQKNEVRTTINEYITYFNLESVYEGKVIQFVTFSQEAQDGFQSLAQTSGMTISLNLLAGYDSKTSLQITNIIRHEMGHTLHTKRNTDTTFTLQNGDNVLGVEGLSIVVLPKGTEEETKIMVIEEAMCDFLAFDFTLTEGIVYDTVNYAALSVQLLLMKLCKKRNISMENLIRYHRTSDMLGFAGAMLGCNDPDMNDIEYLTQRFELLKQGALVLIQDAEKVLETNPGRLAMLPTNIDILSDMAIDKIYMKYQD